MCGSNFVGMGSINDPKSKMHGITPLPRLINQQLDFYLEARIATLEKDLLKDLQTCILQQERSNWFGTYLTIYVYLSNIERDTWSLHTWDHDADVLAQRVAQMVQYIPSIDFCALDSFR